MAALMAVAPTADTAAPVAECTEAAAAPEGRADTGRRHAVSVLEGAGLSKAGATPAARLGSVERALPTGTGTLSEALAAGAGAAEALAAVSAGAEATALAAVSAATAVAVVMAGVALALALVGVLFCIGRRITTVHGWATAIRPATHTRISGGRGSIRHIRSGLRSGMRLTRNFS